MNKLLIFALGVVAGIIVSLPLRITIERNEYVPYEKRGIETQDGSGVVLPDKGFVPFCEQPSNINAQTI